MHAVHYKDCICLGPYLDSVVAKPKKMHAVHYKYCACLGPYLVSVVAKPKKMHASDACQFMVLH